MGFSISLPTIGQPNSTEDVKVNNSLTAISAWGNGNVLGTDLSPTAAIARSQMAGGFGNLTLTSVSGNTSAVDGGFYNVTGASAVTITLPTPTANRSVGVRAGGTQTGTTPVTVTAGAALISGTGILAATLALGTPGSSVVLQADGSNWAIVSGGQDTGWVTLSLVNSWAAVGGNYVPAARLTGSRVELCGQASGGSTTTLCNAIPANMWPAQGAGGACGVGNTAQRWSVTTAGLLFVQSSVGFLVTLDGVSFRLS